MDTIRLKSTREELFYQGAFTEAAFELLSAPIPLYRNLLKRLGPYGAALKDLSVDTSTLSDANLRCALFELGADLRIRLERLEASFFSMHEIGQETAYQIIRGCWSAVREVGGSIVAAEHTVLANIDVQIQDVSYEELMHRYVTMPPALDEKAHAGVVFYMAEDLAHREGQGHVVLDRLVGQDRNLALKLSVTFDAQKVPIENLAQRVDTYVRQSLDYLGLALEREGI